MNPEGLLETSLDEKAASLHGFSCHSSYDNLSSLVSMQEAKVLLTKGCYFS